MKNIVTKRVVLNFNKPIEVKRYHALSDFVTTQHKNGVACTMVTNDLVYRDSESHGIDLVDYREVVITLAEQEHGEGSPNPSSLLRSL